jgi:protein-S-isoprenylcysteine O-methyltransferase Ste14
VIGQFVLGGCVLLGALGPPGWDGAARVVSAGLGIVLILGGLGLVARAATDLQHNLTPLPRPRDGATLVTSGAYRFVRHPIYGGVLLAAIGWSLAWASIPSLVLSGGLLLFFDLKARREEVWLRAELSGYDGYARRTRRLLPWIY